MSSNELQIVIYVLIFISTMLMFDGIIRYALGKKSYKSIKNRRLEILNKVEHHNEALLELRRQRGLGSEGKYVLPIISFNKLLLQSGTSIGAKKLIILMLFLGTASFISVYFFDRTFIFPILAFVVGGVVFPVLWLLTLRRRRRDKIEAQLPESLDVLQRSLYAGHPLSVAIAMVSRELPDPIGSEFGITSDEMTFGLGLETALENMGARIGQIDVSLMMISVSIQSKTGGNLAELLSKLTAVIRDRQTLRRKVKALSAEGKVSAIVLSLLPIVVFFVLLVIAPTFYGNVWGNPLVKPILALAAVLTVIGDIVMYRMVHFKF